MSGRITIDSLSDSLKELINKAGLTEEQVINLINTNGLTEEQVINLINTNGLTEEQVINLIKNNLTGDLAQLNTTNKTNLVAAINELFQNANNGKELIANAIGEPLSSNDTFSAMSGDINGLLSTFKTNMMNNGVTVKSSDRFKSLIDKIATLADNEGKGIQIVEGTLANITTSTTFDETGDYLRINFDKILPFTPTYLIAGNFTLQSSGTPLYMVGQLSNVYSTGSANRSLKIENITTTSFDITYTTTGTSSTFSIVHGYDLTYIAIGVGEEDTTLRDSLASILEEEGVSVSDEDTMASLIGKVDSEFTKDNNTISGLENDISNGKSIIANAIGTPLTATDTFTEMGSDINGLLATFKTNMMNNGVTIESGDKFKALIDKIATLAGNEGKGIQHASGQIDAGRYTFANVNSTHTLSFNEPLNFTPTYLFIRIPYVRYSSTNGSGDSRNAIVSNLFNDIYDSTDWAKQLRVGCISSEGILNIKSVSSSGFVMEGDTNLTFGYSSSTGYDSDHYIDWYAFGVGEELEDTTLRDSLANILQEEGVSVTEEDDMASLISKVDEEFNRKNSLTIKDYNMLYNYGTLNTNMLGGFNFNKSYTSGSTFTEESNCLKLYSWSTSDTYDYAVSKYTVKPYPYTKLKFTYSAEGMDGCCTYELGYTLSSVEHGEELVASKKITTNTNGTVTAEFSLSNNMEPINIVIHGYAPSYADRTAKLYVYKIELL